MFINDSLSQAPDVKKNFRDKTFPSNIAIFFWLYPF